jgi:acylphosphatase
MKAVRFRISGRVQAVGFRAWTRSLARTLELVGTVRNLPDGTVEVVARGPDDAIDRLREALASGPPGARVTRVEEAAAPRDRRKSFEILP